MSIPICKKCGSEYTTEMLTPELPHYGKELCSDCGAFIRWLPKPDSNNRPAKHGGLVKKYSNGYCQMCLRVEPLPGRTVMEAHHVQPYAYGGEDSPENIWIVCSMCHKHIHHVRTYMAHYGERG